MFQSIKDNHLRHYLEDEYNINIIKKYGAYIIVKDGIIVDFFYTLQEVHEFLESKPEYVEILSQNSIPEKLLKKWEKRQLTAEDVEEDSAEQ